MKLGDAYTMTNLLVLNTTHALLGLLLNAGLIEPADAGATLARIANMTIADATTEGEHAAAEAFASTLSKIATALDGGIAHG